MTRREVELELTQLGASYNSKQLAPELREMLKSTREAHGLTGPKRGGAKAGLIPSLSGLSKPQLLARAVTSGVTVNPCWTAGKLMHEIRTGEMLALTPGPSDKLRFGKHQDETFYSIRASDEQYCTWVKEQPLSANPDFEFFRRYLEGPAGEDPSWNLVSRASSSKGTSSKDIPVKKEEPDPEVLKLKQELAAMKRDQSSGAGQENCQGRAHGNAGGAHSYSGDTDGDRDLHARNGPSTGHPREEVSSGLPEHLTAGGLVLPEIKLLSGLV